MGSFLGIWRRSVCAASGAIAGGLAGFLFGLLLVDQPGIALSLADIVLMGALLGILGWVAILVVVGLWLHYGPSAIAAPAFVNALLTSILTVAIDAWLRVAVLCVFVGLLVGTLVGALLCSLCAPRREKGVATHAVR